MKCPVSTGTGIDQVFVRTAASTYIHDGTWPRVSSFYR